MNSLLVWAALPRDGQLRKPLVDGSQPVLRPQQMINFGSPMMMRRAALHARESVLDIILFNHYPRICRARLSGEIERAGSNTIHATSFTTLWIGDAVPHMQRFALQLAERSLRSEQEAGRNPPRALWNAVQAKWQFIGVEIWEASLHRAWDEAIAVWRQPSAPGMIGPVSQEAAWMVRGAIRPSNAYSKSTWGGFKTVILGAMFEGPLARPGFPLTREVLERELTEMFTQAFDR